MAVNITATRTSSLFNDQDGDSVFDPGDVILTRIRITNSGTTDATGVSVTDTLSGVTLVPGSVEVTPIAFDDFMPSITGNTPITFTAAQLLGNDVDPDGAEINLTITGVSNAQHGAIVNNGDGTFTFTPTTGYAGSGLGAASFEYTITDEQGRGSVTTGIVKFDVTDPVWYVNNATGSDITGDGSWAKPFASLAPLSTGGSADALDNADDTIFVYNAGTYANASIVLETNQKLFGDGHAFSVNGLSIGANANNTTLSHAGAAVTLASGNTIDGLDLVGTATGAIGIQDGGVAAGTVTITGTSITGQGQILDIDQGGTLAVTLTNIASTGSTGANGGVIDLTGVGGSLTVSGTTTINGSHGQAGIDISGNSGLTVDFQGNVVVNTGAVTAVNITSNTGTNSITFSGGSKDIDTTTATAVNITGNTTSTTVGFTNGGLDIDSTTGAGLNVDATTLNVTGGTNTINTTTGQILSLVNSQMGTAGIAFTTLGAGTVAAGNAININNLDAAGAGTFQGGAVTVAGTAGASADAINITASNSTFSFASATIGSTAVGNFVAGDGIEINGTTPNLTGAVTFTTVNINGVSGVGVNIVGATNAVNINGGNIGGTNDSGGDGVNINGGTGAVTVAATVTKTTLGNEVVDISNHATGAISFTGAISANSGGGGIRVVNNTSGNIDFTGDVSLSTGTLNGLTFTNTAGTGANLTFTGGTTDITTTSGTGINATNSTVGAGSLTISGASNTVAASTGRAINIDGVTTNATFLSVGVSGGGTTTGIFLKDTGAAGQFIVTGTGSTAGSGGTIANISGGDLGSNTAQATTGTAVYLNNVSNVSLSNMIFGANAGTMTNYGIRGENVNNFTLRDSEFRGTFGTNEVQDESALRFGTQSVSTGLRGTALFEGNVIGGGYEDNLVVYVYGSNTLNMTVQDSANDQAVFNVNSTSFGNDSLGLESGGTSNVTLTVTNVAFNGARGDQLGISQIGSTTQTLNITGNQFLNGHTNTVSGGGGVWLLGGDLGVGTNPTINYTFSGNTIKNAQGDALRAIYTGYAATINGLILNNTIGTNNGVFETNSNGGSVNGGAGIDVGFGRGSGSGIVNYAVRIEGNVVRDIKDAFGGIIVTAGMGGLSGTGRLEATIKNNSVQEVGGNVLAGLYGIVGGASSPANSQDASQLGLVITGNTFTAGSVNGGSAIFFDQLSGAAHYYFPGYTVNANSSHGEFRPGGGGGTASTSLDTFIDATNNLISGPFPSVAGSDVDANFTTGITNQAFVLAVPIMAAPTPGIGWEDLAISPVGAPPRDPDVANGSGAPDNSGDGGTGGGSGESGGGTGGGDTGGGGDPAPTAADDGVLSVAELNFLVEAAIQRWIDAGATSEQVDAMRAVQFGIVDMAGIFVGSSTHGVISVDNDAAGYGWFVDATPGEDSEFDGSGTRLTADAGGAAAGRLDLLTVLMHELGHQIGLGDEYQTVQADDLMYGYVNVGERRLPAYGEAAGAVPGSVGATAFALTPVSIGTLPSNKTVDVFFKSTINAQTDGFIVNLNNDSTISGSNFSNVIANEQNVLDSLTLGSTVYVDTNLNGLFDAGEGRTGVALQLYADTNDSGGWDPADVLLGSTTTGALGAYSFAGLAPGDYIVVVTAANFANGAQLDDLLIVQGVAADPDNNVDNDNNGVAATGGAVASQTITLAYNTEPTNGTGNDVNNTLDFGFVANQPPVANDDSVSVAEDSGANDLTSQLLGNDTDPENDTKTITSATQGAHGTTSVVAGVLTYTPAGNYNGTDTFTYTISDGNGHQDTATVNVTVTAVNDPVTGTAPANASLNEDATNVAIAGMSISDVDTALAPAGVYDVTLSATHGTLTLTTLTGLTFGTGDGTDDTTMTFHGTLAAINTALATAKYTPVGNYNGPAQIDLLVTDMFGVNVATGTGAATNDSDSIAVTVNSVNDEPLGTDRSGPATVGVTKIFTAADFSTGMTDPNDSPANGFAGVKITTPPTTGLLKLNGTTLVGGETVTKTQLDNGNLTFEAAAGSGGTSPTFTFQVQDDGGILNGGVNLDQSANTFTLNVGVAGAAPALDLDGDDSNTVGTGFASSYTEDGPAAAISDTDVDITDADSGDDIVSATVTVTNAVAGDTLTVVGALPGSLVVDPSSTATMLKITGSGTHLQYEAAIQQVTFSSTGNDPTALGTNTSRTITVVVNDGALNSNTATATVSVTGVNDAPVLDLNGAGAGNDATLAFSEGNGITPIAPAATVVDDSPDFSTGTLVVDLTPVGTGDYLAVLAGNGITVDNGAQTIAYNGVDIATYAITNLSATFTFTFNAAATPAAVQALVRQVSFVNQNDNQLSGDRTVTYTLSDGDGGTEAVRTATVSVTAVDDPAVAQPDAVSTPENVVGMGNLFVNNGSGPDSDAEGDSFQVTAVNGAAVVGTTITLASGAKLTVSANGDYIYDPDGKFVTLTDNTSGAVNTSQIDTFQYTITGGSTVTVTVTVNGVAGPGDWLAGDATNNTITGTPNDDFFFVVQGGDDDLSGLAGNDVFFFGGAMTSADQVDGGPGTDQIALQGNYSGGLTFGTDVVSVENLAILPGNDTRFGDPGTNFYDYNITLVDENVASGVQMVVDANRLRVGEDFTFNGSAEMDGSFFIFGGGGVDNLTGGLKNDVFLFRAQGQWGASDVVNGGPGGTDQLALSGDYTIVFGAGQLIGIENIGLVSAFDTRFGVLGSDYDYDLTMNDGNVANGVQMTVDGAALRLGETLAFNGSQESNGSFRVFGGDDADTIIGSQNADILVGRGGIDHLTGGTGNDVFRYNAVADSLPTAKDVIHDFTNGDKIDLSRIDANTVLAGDQAFNFIGSAAFSNTAGELRFEFVSGQTWLIQGDTDGIGGADFAITVIISDLDPITSGDFIP